MKTICIYSRDLDGWMSAAIVKKWFEEQHKDWDLMLTSTEVMTYRTLKGKINTSSAHTITESLSFLEWNYGDDIPNLSEYDKVIMCGISFPIEELAESIKKVHLIVLDHHKSTIEEILKWSEENNYRIDGNWGTVLGMDMKDLSKYAACELTWKYLFPNEEMPEIVRLLGRYTCGSYKGTDEEQKVLEFQYGVRQRIDTHDKAYNYLMNEIKHKHNEEMEQIISEGQKIYQYLKVEAKQIYEKAFPIEFIVVDYKATQEAVKEETNVTISNVFKFLCINREEFNPTDFGISNHNKGYSGFACFWYKKGKWIFSLYSDSNIVDCSIIAKQYGGDGHKEVAEMIVDSEVMLNIVNSYEK